MTSFESADGTPIAYDRHGDGPAVVLVGGGLDDGGENAPLARQLARWFTVFNYARRGRGDSGDTPPHTLAFEAACLGDGEPPVERLAKLSQPVLVTTGGREELFEAAAEVVAASLPAGVRETLTGQGHVVDPAVMAERLHRFFRD